MAYVITFLEGLISFVSPCMLPLLPVYVTYFAGGADKRQRTFVRALFFVLGFTAVFLLLGLFSGTVGRFLQEYAVVVNLVTGALVVLFGVHYLGWIRLPFFKENGGTARQVTGVMSAMLFGMIYSVSLTPCVGAFLGSALALASSSGTAWEGALLLFTYSLGLGVPFVISAVLLDRLQSVFRFIKMHYRVINTVCGWFLIAVGVLMMTGLLHRVMTLFS
ncbi:MAG: sulfite exporter TauE/SafE family protein [Clostridia bacterium]|nr:sulfite exporter TauE/SafE family protein [Clostridia bacterium]